MLKWLEGSLEQYIWSLNGQTCVCECLTMVWSLTKSKPLVVWLLMNLNGFKLYIEVILKVWRGLKIIYLRFDDDVDYPYKFDHISMGWLSQHKHDLTQG